MTQIEWTHRPGTTGVSWNPISGCTPVSEGCTKCYARRMAKRLAGRFGYPETPHEFDVTLHPDRLGQPPRWRKPRTVFVSSMGDLFHESVSRQLIVDVFRVIEATPRHTYLILTKRPQRMKQVLGRVIFPLDVRSIGHMEWPLPNVWLGVTAENQKCADERIPILLDVPAAVRFISVEPMLSPVDIWDYLPEYDYRPTYAYWRAMFPDTNGQPVLRREGLDWIICGAETGSGARPMELQWARDLHDQCKEVGTPYFFKQAGPKGTPIPADLMVREWPNVVK